ncbi:hypothetical protein Tco_0559363 [Tanacetum coccineum]
MSTIRVMGFKNSVGGFHLAHDGILEQVRALFVAVLTVMQIVANLERIKTLLEEETGSMNLKNENSQSAKLHAHKFAGNVGVLQGAERLLERYEFLYVLAFFPGPILYCCVKELHYLTDNQGSCSIIYRERDYNLLQIQPGRIEKWILRNAFDDKEKPYLQHVTDSMLTNANFVYPENTPTTKEAYYYRTIFEKFLPKVMPRHGRRILVGLKWSLKALKIDAVCF